MKSIMMNQCLVISVLILSCLLVSTVQCVAADKTETTIKPSAQKIISQWRAIFPDQPYLCWAKKSPWNNLKKLQTPPKNIQLCQQINLDMGRNEYESASFVLTNFSNKSMEFKITSALSKPKGISTTLRKGVWITAKDGSKVNDALSLIDNDQVTIPAGESREIWITLHSDNAAAGQYKQTIKISSRGLKPQAVNIAVKVHNIYLPQRMPLSTSYWDYVVPGWATPAMNAAKLADLKSHYANKAAVHPSVIPRFAYDENGQLSTTDYTLFDKAIDMYEAGLAPETYVFEMICEAYFEPTNVPNQPGTKHRPKFLSPKWKAGFQKWLKGWVAHMKSRGMGYDKYYLNPYDERLDDHVYQVAKLIKETDPHVRISTVGLGTMQEINTLAPYVDVWTPLLTHWLPIGGVTGAMSQTVSLKPNTKYTFSFFGKNGSSTIYWQLVFDGKTKRAASSLGALDWKQETYSFTTAPDTTKVTMDFFPVVGNGSIFIDDVVLVGSGPNLVDNGGIEIGTTSPPYGWHTNSAMTRVNTTDPYSGSKSVEVTSIPSGSNHVKEALKRVIKKENSSLWTYANPQGVHPSKANPYKYYRVAVWHAWDEGMTGFGYWIYCHREAWNYTKAGAPGEGGFAVVYNATLKDTPPEVSKKELIVPSKRWEATREGVEDYAYLYLLKQAIAKASPQDAVKAKTLLDSCVEKVLKDENNPSLAEKAKKQILEELVRMSTKQAVK